MKKLFKIAICTAVITLFPNSNVNTISASQNLHSETIELIASEEFEGANIHTYWENIIETDKFQLYINNEHFQLEKNMLLYNNTTFLPLREIGEFIGAEVDWNGEYRIAIIKSELEENVTRIIEMPVDLPVANIIIYAYGISNQNCHYINEANHSMKPIVMDGNTYLPLRFIAEKLGFTVTYFNNDNEIHLTENGFDIPLESAKSISNKKIQLENAINSITHYPEFYLTEENINTLNKMISGYGSGVSVFFKDVQSGYTYMNNEHKKYFIASVIKAPYAMYIYDLVSRGEVDLYSKYTYYSRHYVNGAGIIQNSKTGTSYTLEQLLEYSIIHSDNVALKILREAFGSAGFKEYFINLGINYPNDIANITGANITAIDAGVYIENIYNFINTNEFGETLKNDMLNTQRPLIVSSYPVIRKYGSSDNSYHDMAIIDAPHPYFLCILTNQRYKNEIFTNISKKVEEFTNQDDRVPVIRFENVDIDDFLEFTDLDLDAYIDMINSDYANSLKSIEKELEIYFQNKEV